MAQALADPIRRQILRMLQRESLGVTAIANAFEVSRPAISRHLRVLRESGLVLDQSRGRERLYCLEPGGLRELEEFLVSLRIPAARSKAGWQRRLLALDTEVARVRRQNKQAPAVQTQRFSGAPSKRKRSR